MKASSDRSCDLEGGFAEGNGGEGHIGRRDEANGLFFLSAWILLLTGFHASYSERSKDASISLWMGIAIGHFAPLAAHILFNVLRHSRSSSRSYRRLKRIPNCSNILW